jgi:hypothetical protein
LVAGCGRPRFSVEPVLAGIGIDHHQEGEAGKVSLHTRAITLIYGAAHRNNAEKEKAMKPILLVLLAALIADLIDELACAPQKIRTPRIYSRKFA